MNYKYLCTSTITIMYKGPTFAKHMYCIIINTIISNDFNDKIMSIKHCTCNIGERNSMKKNVYGN